MRALSRGIRTGPPLFDLDRAGTDPTDPREEVTGSMKISDYFSLLAAARKREDGQTMAEYAVVLGVITLAVVGVFTALSGGISGAISNVTTSI
jgi:Flp pilus assembly pilin Flp